MIRGLYTSAAGMVAQMEAQDIKANNLANVNTTAFKRDVPSFAAFPEMYLHRLNDNPVGLGTIGFQPVSPVGTLGTGSWLEEVSTIQEQGPVQDTGRSLDFALEGEGFFVVETPRGLRYTRNGSFAEGENGFLVTSEGYHVLGRNWAPLYADTEDLGDQLLVAGFPPGTRLAKEGDSLFVSGDQGQALPGGHVRQGALEQSNVNVVTAMVEMIAGMRAYEANQKALQTQDQTLDKAVNEVGRMG